MSILAIGLEQKQKQFLARWIFLQKYPVFIFHDPQRHLDENEKSEKFYFAKILIIKIFLARGVNLGFF